jgi:hypothetical protein
MERENSPFHAGPDGRSMIEAIIKEAPNKLAPSGRLLMTHNSMANLSKSLHLFESVGMHHRILAKCLIAFRSFIDRKWLDILGGEAAGLYSVKDDVAYETLYIRRRSCRTKAKLGSRAPAKPAVLRAICTADNFASCTVASVCSRSI